MPWAVAAIALLALIALVAGQRFGRSPSEAPATAAATSGGNMAGRAPDISNMSPEERKRRLYDRVMTYAEAGRADSLAMFAPMAIATYQQSGALDLDGRYDLGRLGEVSGDIALAAAQADTILQAAPTHLLGLILAARAARLRNDAAAERAYLDRFVAAETAERAKQLPEYQTHGADINSAATAAKAR